MEKRTCAFQNFLDRFASSCFKKGHTHSDPLPGILGSKLLHAPCQVFSRCVLKSHTEKQYKESQWLRMFFKIAIKLNKPICLLLFWPFALSSLVPHTLGTRRHNKSLLHRSYSVRSRSESWSHASAALDVARWDSIPQAEWFPSNDLIGW